SRAVLARLSHHPRRVGPRPPERRGPAALVRRAEVAGVIAVLLFSLLAAPLDLADYRARLERIDFLLDRGNLAAAAEAARALLDETIRAGDEELFPDGWTLSPIAGGEPHRARLRA